MDIRYLHRLESHGKAIKISTLKDGYEEFVHFRRFSSAAAYLVNRKAAASIANYAYPIKLPVDVYLNRSWEFDINEVLIKPVPTLLHDNYRVSDKHEASSVEIDVKTKKNLITRINGFKHRIKTIVARDIYQFVILFKTRFPGKK